MQRIQAPNATPENLFSDGDPTTGLPATEVSAAWLNGVQEELVGIIEAADDTPDGGESDQVLKSLMKLVYPVGSVYITQNLLMTPFQLFGIGTWVEICKGRVPVGLDPDVTEFNLVGKTGGAKTHLLTLAEMPSHAHAAPGQIAQFDNGGAQAHVFNASGVGATTGAALGQTAEAGGGQPHNNLQPYEVVGRVWKRTA